MAAIHFCAYDYLVNSIDRFVQDPNDPEYQAIKAEIITRLERREGRNPFGAGRKPIFDDDRERAVSLAREGKRYDEIAQIIGCSKSTVSRLVSSSW